MNTLSRLLVELGLDDSGMESGLDKSKKNMQEWAKGLRDTGTKLTASVTAPVVGMFALMINGASDANESMSAVKTVYGDAADAIIDSSRKAANTVGLSQNQYLSAAATMGVYAQSAGITGDAMSKFGQDMIGASADLASFYNANPTDVLQAIQSGLMGEAEPLRKYGILISEASINQYAWTHGIAQTGEQLTEQQKVAARYGYIMANLGPASGDFERTSAGLANQMRILKARVKDVAAQFGVYLLPFMLKAAKAAQRLITFIQSLSDRQKKLVLVLAAVGAAIGPILIVISMMIPAVIALASAFGLLLGPIGLVVLAIAGLAYAYKTNFMGFGDAVNTVVGYVVTFSKAIAEAFTSGKPVSDLVAGLPKPLQEVGRGFLLIADAIGDLIARWRSGGFDAMLAALPEELAQIGQGFRALGRVLLNLAGKALDALLPAFGSLAGKILDSIGDLASGLKTWFENAVSSVDWGSFGETVGEKVGNLSRMLAPKAWEIITGLTNELWDNKKTIATSIFKLILAVPAVIGFVGKTMIPKALEFLKGFVRGLDINWPLIGNWFKSLPGKIVNALGYVLNILVQQGRDFIAGLKAGIDARWDQLKAWLGGLRDRVATAIGVTIGELVQQGKDFITGLSTGIHNRWISLYDWLAALPQRIVDTIGEVSGKLVQAGKDLLGGFKSGAQYIWTGGGGEGGGLEGWFKGLPGRIAGAMRDAAASAYNSLYDAGWQIFKPIYDGILAGYNLLPGWIRDKIGWAVGSVASASLSPGAGPAASAYGMSRGSQVSAAASAGTSQVTFANTYNINGVNDPEKIAAEVSAIQARQWRQTVGVPA